MRKNVEEKSLIIVNEKNIFHKIKMFLINLFARKNTIIDKKHLETIETNENQFNNNQKKIFLDYIKNIENKEIKMLELQKQYENNEISENQLSKEQIGTLIDLYNKQINELRKSNEIRKQKLLQYRKRMQNVE